ncbi:hypothetical protein KC19_4G256200 [Ceratodon purpureus]|uniref:Uncharacterized protein n=1 Tax=Ceratodon purpureus TaxID=3225 RepID=A0A8T0IG20_CERPU|nr:hypothetical protein KC19_4G256200 [Ceratodon purpureus]
MSIFDIDIPEGIPDETYATDRENSSRSEGSNASIYKEYGGFNEFLLTYGLRNYNQDDVEGHCNGDEASGRAECQGGQRAATSYYSSATQPAARTRIPAEPITEHGRALSAAF